MVKGPADLKERSRDCQILFNFNLILPYGQYELSLDIRHVGSLRKNIDRFVLK